ncbi:MAG: segregation/condensation protein A [Eubacteriales bacterium]
MAEANITYQLDAFEGPLDLLLALISKNKVSITDIPIALIFEQYMAYLNAAQSMDMELTSEFIVMASELMLIKSRMLLPRENEEDDDPRKELADALLLYQQTKNRAELLKPLYAQYFGRMAKDNDDIPPEKGVPLGLDVELLTGAFTMLLTRYQAIEHEPQNLVQPLIRPPVVSVRQMIDEVLLILQSRASASLYTLLRDAKSKAELIARFMGILEMIKLQQILICTEEGEESSEQEEGALLGLLFHLRLNPDYVENTEAESEFDIHDDEPNTH